MTDRLRYFFTWQVFGIIPTSFPYLMKSQKIIIENLTEEILAHCHPNF